jgi:hypothetical protein
MQCTLGLEYTACSTFYKRGQEECLESHAMFWKYKIARKIGSKTLHSLQRIGKSHTVCDYSHFFSVRWTHKIAEKCFIHAQKLREERSAFDQIRRISFQEIKNGSIHLQKIVDEADRKALFTSHF